jgi:DNA-binding transcriptional LysR family regulator
MDKLQAMRIFVRVAELNSFSGVAQQLGVARSVVTRQVAALENHLGTKLMARSTRRLTLTSEGASYLEKCRVILNLVDAAETGIAEERLAPRGLIRISVPLSFGLKRVMPHLLEFVRRYPEVNLDMDYSDRRVNLIEDGIDLSIRITHKLESTDVVRKISHSRLCVIASPDYLARCGTPLHPAELTHHQCLGYTIAGGQQAWQFLINDKLLSFPLRSQINANNGEALTEAAAQGLGITCQPDFIAQPYLASGKVKEILTNYSLPELGIYAMLPSNRQIPHRVRVLMEFLISEIGISN